ncbi:MAG TPA: hypothetical protein VFT13_05575, partial [Candidatus Krumholzibacteria bacterium]|nr:hypothetical protein [Candidatus Krumholzibacteria bacterium]
MRTRRLMLLLSTACLTGAWSALFLRHFAGVAWTRWLPVWAIMLLLVVAAAGAILVRGSARRRAGVWIAVVLTWASFFAFSLPLNSAGRAHENWKRESGERIARTLADVGDRIARLEDASASLADRVADHVRALETPAGEDPTVSFALLDSLARSATSGTAFTPGTAIGLQLFDATGRRVAWAGWPQSTSLLDEMFIRSGTEVVYTRSVSLYQILSHVVPIRTGDDTPPVATLLVDLPLEVDYRVNNRFLKSTSLADQIPRGGVARVSFDYYPATGNLPDRLPRLKEQQRELRERRERLIAAAPVPAPERAEADSTTPHAPARSDSVLSYYPFPANVEPAGEIFGDDATGLQGRVVVRSRVANSILNVTAVGYPFAHYEGQWTSRRAIWGRALALAALFALFFQAMRWTPSGARPRDVLARASLFAAFMVALRFALLSFGARSAWTHVRLFDPSVFATPTLGGLMRSTFDLAVTSLFLVILVYGLVRIARARIAAPPAGAPPARLRAVETAAVAGIFLATGELIRRFTNTVVVNANPRLLGETMEITDPSLIVLHTGVFLMVTGILLAGLFLAWGLMRALGEWRRTAVCGGALVIVAIVSVLAGRWDPLGVSVLLALFVVFAPRVVHREDLVSVGIVSFCLVVIASAAAYTYLARDYDELRKGFVLEKSAELANPSDN